MQPLTREYHREIKQKTRAEFQEWVRQYALEVTRQNSIDYHFALTLALRDKLGFGQKRIIEFIQKIDQVFKDLNKEVITHEDISGALEEEVKIIMEKVVKDDEQEIPTDQKRT